MIKDNLSMYAICIYAVKKTFKFWLFVMLSLGHHYYYYYCIPKLLWFVRLKTWLTKVCSNGICLSLYLGINERDYMTCQSMPEHIDVLWVKKCLKNLRCYVNHFFYCLDLDSGDHEQSFPINLINTLSVL